MSEVQKKKLNLPLVLGILGLIAGISLLFINGNLVVGISGSIASAGLAYTGYQELKKANNQSAPE